MNNYSRKILTLALTGILSIATPAYAHNFENQIDVLPAVQNFANKIIAPNKVPNKERLTAIIAFRQNDLTNALPIFKKFAESGDMDAQYIIGIAHMNGVGMPTDYPQALQWFQKAAKQGYAPAQFYSGFLYEFGAKGIQKNEKQAFYWYQKAAKQGIIMAQFRLGLMYQTGKGTKVDKQQANNWLSKAAIQGHDRAVQALRELN